jgi:hypothetical protein
MTAFDAALSTDRLVVTARYADGVEDDGPVDGYDTLTGVIRLNDTGEMTLVLPLNHPANQILLTPGAGIVVRRDGSSTVLQSGSWARAPIHDDARATVEYAFTDDNVIASTDYGWSDPLTELNAPGSRNQDPNGVDARTGPAETVLLGFFRDNIGPNAFARRRWPGLVVPATQGRGTSGTWRSNFDRLDDLARSICQASGIAYRFAQGAAGQINLSVRSTVDRSADVVFSRAEGSLESATYTTVRPEADEALVVAATSGTGLRTWVEVVNTEARTRWRFRNVTKLDASTDVVAEMQQAAGEALDAAREKGGLSATPVTLPGAPRYGVDYLEGDRVWIVPVIGNGYSDVITEVSYEHSSGQPLKWSPSVGVKSSDEAVPLVPVVRRLVADMRKVR